MDHTWITEEGEESAVDKMDAEIRSLFKPIAVIRRRRNGHTSNFKSLPKDIVVELFRACIVEEASQNDSVSTQIQNLRLVCADWNDLIEATPRLWAYIQIGATNKDWPRSHNLRLWIQKSLFMSRDALLELSIRYPMDIGLMRQKWEEKVYVVKELLFPEFHRWRSCYFNLPMTSVAQHLENLRKPAPCIQNFSFEIDPTPPPDIILISDLFGNNAPHLRRLEIPHLAINWDSSFLRNLTKLSILAWDGYNTPSTEQYSRMLMACPELEALHLYGSSRHLVRPGADFGISVQLPRLKVFELKYIHILTSRSLISSIDTTSCTDITLLGVGGDPLEGLISCTILQSIIRSTRFIEICTPFGTTHSVIFSSERGRLSYSSPEAFSVGSVLRSLLSDTDRSNIVRLHLHPAIEWSGFSSDLACEDFFEGMENVRSLETGHYVQEIMTTLSRPMANPEVSGSFVWLLPKLRYLEAYDYDSLLDFLEGRYGTQTQPTQTTSDISHEPPPQMRTLIFHYKLIDELREEIQRRDDENRERVEKYHAGFRLLTWRSGWYDDDYDIDDSGAE